MDQISSIVGLGLVILLVPKILSGGNTKKVYKFLLVLLGINLFAFVLPMGTVDWPHSFMYYALSDTPALLLPFFFYLISLIWIVINKKPEYSVFTFLAGVASMFYALFFAFNSMHPAHEPIAYTFIAAVASVTLLVSPFAIFLLYINIAAELSKRNKRSI